MNSKNLDEKPWENISLNEIQPYPSNYTKIVVLSYGLGAFTIVFEVLGDLSPNANELLLVLLSRLLIYGALAFSLLYLYSDGLKKFMLSTLKNYLEILIPLTLILEFIWLLIYGISFAELLKIITTFPIMMVTLSLIWPITIFFLMAISFGPIPLIESEHPQGEIHGFITIFIVILVIFLHLILFKL